MNTNVSLKLLVSGILSASLVACGGDDSSSNKSSNTDTSIDKPITTPDNSEKATFTGAGISVYGDVPKDKFKTVALDGNRETLLLDDVEAGANYSGMGLKLLDRLPEFQPAAFTMAADVNQVGIAPEVESTVSPLLRTQADEYLNHIQTVLKEYEGAEVNVLTNQVGSNAQSSTIKVELGLNFGSRVKSANYVRNAVLKAVNDGVLPADTLGTEGKLSDKVNLQLIFWQDGDDILLWTGSSLPDESESVESKYGDLKTGAALTSSRVLTTSTGKNEFDQTEGNSGGVDILWSIDASGSMSEEQQNLANGAEQFFDSLTKAGVDYRLAVNTQGYEGYSYNCTTLRQTQSGASFIDNKTANGLDEWRYLARPGTYDSSTETGFYCAREVDLTGFDRPDAKNLVVFVSDEPENETFSGYSPSSSSYEYTKRDFNDYKQYFRGTGATYFSITGTGSLLRPTFDDDVRSYDDENFECYGEGGSAAGGGHFAEIAKLTGGSSASICSDAADWSTMFDRIIETATGLASRFNLDKTPIAPSVKVTVNGKEVPRDIKHENGFDLIYGQLNTAVTFYGNSLPNKGDKIVVTYSYVKSN